MRGAAREGKSARFVAGAFSCDIRFFYVCGVGSNVMLPQGNFVGFFVAFLLTRGAVWSMIVLFGFLVYKGTRLKV